MPATQTQLARFSVQLEEHIRTILKEEFGLAPLDEVGISSDCVYDVVHSAACAMRDMRHRYPFSVSIVKYISNTIFWLIKLKPINACGLTAIDSGCLAEVRDINEQIALYWGMEMMLRAVTTNYIPELITSSPENVKNVRAIMYSYIKNNVYFDKKGFPMEGTQKYKETVYYFRYKKFTAVNIYEMIVHMIIGFREGRGMPPLPEATI